MKKRLVGANLIEKDGKILLIQETLPIAYGLWNFPAGKLDPGETIEQCTIREGKEESGFNLEIENEIGVYRHPSKNPKDNAKEVEIHVFKTKILNGELNKPNEEIMDLKWFTPEEIGKLLNENKLREPFIWEAVKKYLGTK